MLSAPASAAAEIPVAAGIGLRLPHHALAVAGDAPACWFEVHAENYMYDAAACLELRAVRRRYPLSIHAVGLSLGSAQGLDPEHLARFRELVQELRPGLVSDHLSWSRAPGIYLPDLLPLPYTQEALNIMCRNVEHAQSALDRSMLVENPSSYVEFCDSTLSEAQFLAALARHTGCGVLLDINNVYVGAHNRGLDPRHVLEQFLDALPAHRIGELHLAGHATLQETEGRVLRIDDHGAEVCADVWVLYEAALAVLGPRPTLIEWDTRIPAFGVLMAEATRAQLRLEASRAAINAVRAHAVAR